ncbi:MAG: DUF951 domain-containing protein [Eubacteriales bacterium]|nr:DUF951 domain-containing protein [Eubacteriales bacterium]
MEFLIGDKVKMKKVHPCGSYEWEIIRVGADFKIKCLKCGHIAMISRVKFEKRFKSKIEND